MKENTFWSIRHADWGYADDHFNGTYKECVSYAKKNKFHPEDFYLVERTKADDFAINMVKGTDL